VADPTYDQVAGGGTGHAEALRVRFDRDRTSYARLLVAYWHTIDPVAVDRQFCDTGPQYRTVIFYHNPRQRRLAELSRQLLAESGRFQRPIATAIQPAEAFYRAEAYHQAYYRKRPESYAAYRRACGREQRLRAIWGELAGKDEAGAILAPLLEEGPGAN